MVLWMLEKIIAVVFFPLLNRRIIHAGKSHDESTILAALTVKQHMVMARSTLWEWRHGMGRQICSRLKRQADGDRSSQIKAVAKGILAAAQRGVN